jgi:hypothetical protein
LASIATLLLATLLPLALTLLTTLALLTLPLLALALLTLTLLALTLLTPSLRALLTLLRRPGQLLPQLLHFVQRALHALLLLIALAARPERALSILRTLRQLL